MVQYIKTKQTCKFGTYEVRAGAVVVADLDSPYVRCLLDNGLIVPLRIDEHAVAYEESWQSVDIPSVCGLVVENCKPRITS